MQLAEFRNEPLSDFKGNPAYHRRMEYALDEVRNELGREYDLVISGERVSTADKIRSYNPSHPDQIVGIFSKADASLADRAVLAAADAFKSWSRTPVEKRVELLLRTATVLRERKYDFEARLVYEVGKTWPEADAEVAEAIDFAEFYAREMLRLAGSQPLPPVPG